MRDKVSEQSLEERYPPPSYSTEDVIEILDQLEEEIADHVPRDGLLVFSLMRAELHFKATKTTAEHLNAALKKVGR